MFKPICKFFKRNTSTILACLLTAILIGNPSWASEIFRVSGKSMKPTLKSGSTVKTVSSEFQEGDKAVKSNVVQVGDTYKVNGSSMEPTLHSGDYVQTLDDTPTDGDMVVATLKDGRNVIKRIDGDVLIGDNRDTSELIPLTDVTSMQKVIPTAPTALDVPAANAASISDYPYVLPIRVANSANDYDSYYFYDPYGIPTVPAVMTTIFAAPTGYKIIGFSAGSIAISPYYKITDENFNVINNREIYSGFSRLIVYKYRDGYSGNNWNVKIRDLYVYLVPEKPLYSITPMYLPTGTNPTGFTHLGNDIWVSNKDSRLRVQVIRYSSPSTVGDLIIK